MHEEQYFHNGKKYRGQQNIGIPDHFNGYSTGIVFDDEAESLKIFNHPKVYFQDSK